MAPAGDLLQSEQQHCTCYGHDMLFVVTQLPHCTMTPLQWYTQALYHVVEQLQSSTQQQLFTQTPGRVVTSFLLLTLQIWTAAQ